MSQMTVSGSRTLAEQNQGTYGPMRSFGPDGKSINTGSRQKSSANRRGLPQPRYSAAATENLPRYLVPSAENQPRYSSTSAGENQPRYAATPVENRNFGLNTRHAPLIVGGQRQTRAPPSPHYVTSAYVTDVEHNAMQNNHRVQSRIPAPGTASRNRLVLFTAALSCLVKEG